MLAEAEFPCINGGSYDFRLAATGPHIQASIDGQTLFAVDDTERPLDGGGVAFVIEEGRVMSDEMRVAGVVAAS